VEQLTLRHGVTPLEFQAIRVELTFHLWQLSLSNEYFELGLLTDAFFLCHTTRPTDL